MFPERGKDTLSSPMETKERRWQLVLAAALYTAYGLFYLRPVWQVWQDRIAPNTADPLFNLWVLKWGVHQIRSGLPDLWEANIFHPTPGTLALSDHLIGPALQIALFDNAIAGYNFLFFTSFVLTGLAVCWVIRRSGASWIAATLAGAMYAFSPFRLTHLNHIQILLAQWVPLTLWFWDRLLAERRVRHAVLFLVFYLLNLTGGAYLAYMVHIPLLVILINRAAIHRRELLGGLRVLIPVALVAGGALAAVFLPYVTVGKELAPRPVRWARLDREEDFPEVYSWIAKQDDVQAILELPVRPNNSETAYMYYSTLHWKPIANGFSGYRPESHRRITESMRFLPDEKGLDLLSELRIRTWWSTPGR